MPPEIAEEFLWGPPISRGRYLESQRILWQSPTFTGRTGDVQDWPISTSAFRGPDLERMQSLVFTPAASGPVVALRWAVPRSRPGWLTHGAVLPADATAWDALAVGSVLRMADEDVESRYRDRPDTQLDAPDSPPRADPSALDLGAVWQLRNAILANGQVALVGPNEATIRAHLAAALSITPAAKARGLFFSTMESRVDAASPLRVVGLVEGLWKGAFPESAVRIGTGAGHPGWLAPALRSPIAGEYLRCEQQDLQPRETELAALFVRGQASEALLRRFLSRGDYRALDDAGVDPVRHAFQAVAREELWTPSLFVPTGRYNAQLIPHLADTRSVHSDEYLLSVLGVLDRLRAQQFWRSVARDSRARNQIHPNCHLPACSLRESFDMALTADAGLREHLLREQPALLPADLLPDEQVVADVLAGRRSADEAGQILDRTDAVGTVCAAVDSALGDEHSESHALADRLLGLINRNPTVERRVHRQLLARTSTYDFAVGPYLDVLTHSLPPADRTGEILPRLLHPDSHLFAHSGLPRGVSAYADEPPSAPMPLSTDDLLRRILLQRPAADAFLAGVLPLVGPGDARDVVRRFWPEIAGAYGLPTLVVQDRAGVPVAPPAQAPPTYGSIVVPGAADSPQPATRRILPWLVASAGVVAVILALVALRSLVDDPRPTRQPAPVLIGPTPIGEGAEAGVSAPVPGTQRPDWEAMP
jgi:hypothetical protein